MPIIDIKVPAESHEGTTMKVQTWLKKVGDTVVEFEPLVEMETDKVSVEIEAPANGVLQEILVLEGSDVEPEMIIARLNTDQAESSAQARTEDPATIIKEEKQALIDRAEQDSQTDREESKNLDLSPAVKNFIHEHKLDIEQIRGTGKDNRITLKDVKRFHASSRQAESKTSSVESATGSQFIAHTTMRRSIAEHMASSVAEAPHVTAVFEADFSAITAHRAKVKQEFAERGVKLSYTAYIVMACAQAMKTVPEINSRWHDDSIEIFSELNIGVGTALDDKGLVVPVLNNVEKSDLFDVATKLQDITNKARENKLKPADMKGGTFTISNHGVSGSLLATPIIINQPQSAILGIGKLEKRVVVRTVDGQDSMQIKPMAYVSLTIDHRVIDGYQTNAWLTEFVSALENWSSD